MLCPVYMPCRLIGCVGDAVMGRSEGWTPMLYQLSQTKTEFLTNTISISGSFQMNNSKYLYYIKSQALLFYPEPFQIYRYFILYLYVFAQLVEHLCHSVSTIHLQNDIFHLFSGISTKPPNPAFYGQTETLHNYGTAGTPFGYHPLSGWTSFRDGIQHHQGQPRGHR